MISLAPPSQEGMGEASLAPKGAAPAPPLQVGMGEASLAPQGAAPAPPLQELDALVAVTIALAALTITLFQAITLFLPSRSLLPPSQLPFAFGLHHHCSPTAVVAATIALVAVACLHCHLHRYCPLDHGRGNVPPQLYWHEGGYIKKLSERVKCFEI